MIYINAKFEVLVVYSIWTSMLNLNIIFYILNSKVKVKVRKSMYC